MPSLENVRGFSIASIKVRLSFEGLSAEVREAIGRDGSGFSAVEGIGSGGVGIDIGVGVPALVILVGDDSESFATLSREIMRRTTRLDQFDPVAGVDD